MDTGDGPELCLGPVAESYPPQCSGPPVEGWDWASYRGTFDRVDDVRWGAYAVTGTWDGTTFTVAGAITAALYDAVAPEEPVHPDVEQPRDEAELQEIADDLGAVDGGLPGAQGAYADGERVLVDVLYDDGSLQEWADATYGVGAVVVTGALVDVG
ncbi:MAG: hypothetical protein CMH83_08065 [Nocardioides sp.]|nr:hypothetical protein [Nocardioides sp.]